MHEAQLDGDRVVVVVVGDTCEAGFFGRCLRVLTDVFMICLHSSMISSMMT